MRRSEALLLAVVFALLAGCASTGSEPRSRNERMRDNPNVRAAELQAQLGRGYLDQGKYETAHERLKRAIELDPGSVDAQTLMGLLYERLDRPKLSEKHYRRAFELDPDDGSVNNNLGTYLCSTGRYEEADGHFRRAVEDPFYKTPSVALSNAGVCASQSGNVAASEAYFRRSLELNPNDAGALYRLANIAFDKSDFMRARAFIQRFESAAPADASALELGAKIEERLGDATAAAKYRERLKTEFPDYEPGAANRGSSSP